MSDLVHSGLTPCVPAAQTDGPAAHLLTDNSLLGQTYSGEGPWRCFHCAELCETVEAAEHHFGRYDGCTPICQVAAETYRALEREVQSYRSECDADTVLFYSLGAKHTAALRDAEQTGYDRGLADVKAYPEVLGLMPSRWVAMLARFALGTQRSEVSPNQPAAKARVPG